jgi:spore coat polysaccharide biosynthesis predicted glycosyltransferase SpsG
MNIAFRVDASTNIGTGHFMRCLTLADPLKQRGVQIRFVSRHVSEHLRDMLTTEHIRRNMYTDHVIAKDAHKTSLQRVLQAAGTFL